MGSGIHKVLGEFLQVRWSKDVLNFSGHESGKEIWTLGMRFASRFRYILESLLDASMTEVFWVALGLRVGHRKLFFGSFS